MYFVVEEPRSKMCWLKEDPPAQLIQPSKVKAVADASGVDGIVAIEVVPLKLPAFAPPNGPAPPKVTEVGVAVRVPAESTMVEAPAASSKRYCVAGLSPATVDS